MAPEDMTIAEAIARTLEALSGAGAHTIRAYRNPVLIIHGTDDPVVPLSYSERAAETYENAELKIIKGAGHGFYWGEPFVLSMEYTISFLKDRG